MKFSPTDENEIKKFFVIFYIVGTIGILVPFSSDFFKMLTPITLLLVFFYLAYFNKTKIEPKIIFVFSTVFIVSYVVEALGVYTGKIFGQYVYGKNLGPKLFDTPILIGINWLFLVYTTSSIFNRKKISPIIRIFLASASMLIYDIVLEQVAPKMDMWSWQGGIIPINNYIVWFTMAVVFHSLFEIFKNKNC
jgi:uncharacterized membrane protein